MSNKPILFHDIDGVLFGYYGPSNAFQLRPGLGDWLSWVHEHFEVVWLTTWREPQIRELLTVIWPRSSTYRLPSAPARLKVADWYQHTSKEAWILENIASRYVEWYWIDDMIQAHANDNGEAQPIGFGIDPKRCIWVNPEGEHALCVTQKQLDEVRKTLPSAV